MKYSLEQCDNNLVQTCRSKHFKYQPYLFIFVNIQQICFAILKFKYFALYLFVLHLMDFCTWFNFYCYSVKCLIFQTFIYFWKHIPSALTFFKSNKICKTLIVINVPIRTLLIEILYTFRTTKCWSTQYLHMFVLGWYKFECFILPTLLLQVSYSIDVCSSIFNNIRNIHVVLTNQIVDILYFNNN